MSALFCYKNVKATVSTFSNFSQFEVVIVVEGRPLCPLWVLTASLVSPLLWQRAGQEPERNAGDEQQGGRHQKAHPPGAHPAGIFRGDGHTVWMAQKSF